MKVSLAYRGVSANPYCPSLPAVKKIVDFVFKAEKKRSRSDVNVIFVDNKTIRRINKKFLNENTTTDVIAFPYEMSPSPETDSPFGDIFISIPVAKSNAALFNEKTNVEIVRLIVHGLLHLLGYDDHSTQDRKIMWDRQERYVKALRIA